VSEPLHFLFGVHNHQPVGNFDGVIADAVTRAYAPFLEAVRDVAAFPLSVHCSGGLLAWMRERARPTFDRLGELASAGRIELLGGGFYEPVLPMLPEADAVGQIEALAEFLSANFGVRPRGIWLAERVWEPQLPRLLRRAGVEYVLVDDHHFELVGADPAALGGYYLTEDQGHTLAIFPIDQRLRYLVPFADPAESVRYLESRRDVGSVTLVDDGEKFGAWPGTDRLVYGERWLGRWMEALARIDWLRPSTFARYLDAAPSRGRVYLPTASYAEMGQWALPAAAAAELGAARARLRALPEGERLGELLRGGFWRTFLIKYPEVGDAYWRMLRISARLAAALAARPDDTRLLAARERLWQGQANDAYWHGVFGGCYLPHLRRAVRSALAGAEAGWAEATGAPPECEHADGDGDGLDEIRVRTGALALTVRPDAGGAVTELVVPALGLDLADVLTRRPEAYHRRIAGSAPAGGVSGASVDDRLEAKEAGLERLLGYDTHRRASLMEALLPAEGYLNALVPLAGARACFADRALGAAVERGPDRFRMRLSAAGSAEAPALDKAIEVSTASAGLRVHYRLTWPGAGPLAGRWVVQLNLALTAGDAPGRYYREPGQPSLGSRGGAAAQRGLTMVDEWLGGEVALSWSAPAEVRWAPVETVSLSEAGFERIYQGSSIAVAWPLRVAAGGTWEVELGLEVRACDRRGKSP